VETEDLTLHGQVNARIAAVNAQIARAEAKVAPGLTGSAASAFAGFLNFTDSKAIARSSLKKQKAIIERWADRGREAARKGTGPYVTKFGKGWQRWIREGQKLADLISEFADLGDELLLKNISIQTKEAIETAPVRVAAAVEATTSVAASAAAPLVRVLAPKIIMAVVVAIVARTVVTEVL
jgi:Zn-dependent M28 family amino/carboxypeptidase